MNKVKVVAIAFAFTLVFVAFSAQPVAAASRFDSLSSYMSSKYDPVRGGYTFEAVTRMNPTFGGISILHELGSLSQRPPPISITQALDFLVDQQLLTGDPDITPRYGGFSEYLLGPVVASTNYRGLVTWQLLKSQSGIPNIDDYDINATANAFWINRTISEEGGYGTEVEANPDLVSTFYALASLRIIDQMYQLENAWNTYVNETAVIEWIESCREGEAYKLNPFSERTSVTATAAAVLAYNAIDPLTTVPASSSVQSWIQARQVLEYDMPEFVGGFEEGNATEDPNIVSTYFALKALDTLNALTPINETAAETFILNCQSADGSWGNVPGQDMGSLVYSAYACQMLNILNPGNTLNILSSSFDPHSSPGFIIDWRGFVVLGIIVAAAVIGIFALRMD